MVGISERGFFDGVPSLSLSLPVRSDSFSWGTCWSGRQNPRDHPHHGGSAARIGNPLESGKVDGAQNEKKKPGEKCAGGRKEVKKAGGKSSSAGAERSFDVKEKQGDGGSKGARIYLMLAGGHPKRNGGSSYSGVFAMGVHAQ